MNELKKVGQKWLPKEDKFSDRSKFSIVLGLGKVDNFDLNKKYAKRKNIRASSGGSN